MKYMNNRYGQSMIFGKRMRFAEPETEVNLDSADPDENSGGGGGTDDHGDDGNNDLTIDDLQAQLAKVRADLQRAKAQSDKNAKEAKQYKDQARAHMSAEQQAQAAQAERDAEFESMKKELRVSKYSKRLVGIGMDEESADKMANVIPAMEDADAFFDYLGNFVNSVKKTSGDAAVQQLLKDRPEINAGGGDADKDSTAMQFAKKLAEQRSSAKVNADILKNYQ